MSNSAKIAKLKETGDVKTTKPTSGTTTMSVLPWTKAKPFEYTYHAFGYIPNVNPGSGPVDIVYAGNITPDVTLKNSKIKITLDRLRVADYPGGGVHRVLFDFSAQNQIPGTVEIIHFNQTYRASEGAGAGVVGYPVFIDLNVGNDGVAFKCSTVNVSNQSDEKFLDALESGPATAGLQLLTTAQPAIKPFTDLALGITKSIAARNRNVAVQDFFMGLDFSNSPTRARLAQGAYIAVQVPSDKWDWSEWQYDPNTGRILKKGTGDSIPYNYVVFSVSRS
ncbi:MAG: hypothetical protein ABIU86_02625 [Gemmatimonadaceae bacterium]